MNTNRERGEEKWEMDLAELLGEHSANAHTRDTKRFLESSDKIFAYVAQALKDAREEGKKSAEKNLSYLTGVNDGRKEAYGEMWVIFDTLGAAALLGANNINELVKQACDSFDKLSHSPDNQPK